MRLLYINRITKVKIAHVKSYAEENPYYPGATEDVPGDNKNYVVYLNTFRCVFTHTHSKGKVYRHLTISVPSAKYPNPAAAFIIAQEFGFTGWDGKTIDKVPRNWAVDVNKKEHCIVLVQEIKEK
jgi:hypothetical protein